MNMNKIIKSFYTFLGLFFINLSCSAGIDDLSEKLHTLINENKYVEAYKIMSTTEYGEFLTNEQYEVDFLYCQILKKAFEESVNPFFKTKYVNQLEKIILDSDFGFKQNDTDKIFIYTEFIKDLSTYYLNTFNSKTSNSKMEDLISKISKLDIPVNKWILATYHNYYEYLIRKQQCHKFYPTVTIGLSRKLGNSAKDKLSLAKLLHLTSLSLYFDYTLKENDYISSVIENLLNEATNNYGNEIPYDLPINNAIFYSGMGYINKAIKILSKEEKRISLKYGKEGIEYAWYLFHDAMVHYLDGDREKAKTLIHKSYLLANNINVSEEDTYRYLYICYLKNRINSNDFLNLLNGEKNEVTRENELQLKSIDYYESRIIKTIYSFDDTENKIDHLFKILGDLEKFPQLPLAQYLKCYSSIVFFAENLEANPKEIIGLPSDMSEILHMANDIEDEHKDDILNMLFQKKLTSYLWQLELRLKLLLYAHDHNISYKISLFQPLAEINFKQGNWETAKYLYKGMLKYFIEDERYISQTIRSLTNLSICYLKTEETDSCSSFLEFIDMTIKKDSINMDFRIKAEIYDKLGDIYKGFNDLEKAIKYYNEANYISKESFQLMSLYYNTSYKIAEILFVQRKYRDCAKLLIPVCLAYNGVDNLDNMYSMLIKSLVLSDDVTAYDFLKKFIEYNISEFIPCYFTEMSQFERDQLWSYKSSLIIELCTEVAYKFTQDEIKEFAYNSIIYIKSLDIETQKLIKESIGNMNQYYQRTYQNLIDAVDSLHYGDPSKKLLYKNNISFAQVELSRFINNNKLLDQNKRIFSKLRRVKKDTAIIEFVLIPNNNDATYFAYITQNKCNSPQIIKVCNSSDITPLISTNKDCVNRLYTNPELLRDILWNKVEKCLNDSINNVIIVPTGVLNRINFSAIPYGNERLTQKYNIVRASNIVSLFNYNPALDKEPKSAALFGDIKYNLTREEIIAESEKYNTNRSATPLDINNDRGKIHSLPYTFLEVNDIRQHLIQNGYHVNLFSKNTASEAAFKQLSGKSPQIIHVASHGFYLKDTLQQNSQKYHNMLREYKYREKSLLYSGVLLSGAQYLWNGNKLKKGVEDGILTADEISRMDLSKTKLVVLSACETALGDIDDTEGVIGLQRAFKKAGAGIVVMSLWPVADAPTAKLMKNFYSNLMGENNINDAMQKAIDQVRKEYPNPVDWAGFIICY